MNGLTQGVLRRTEVFSLAGYELPGQLRCDIFGRMPALRVLILDGVEFGDRGIEQELPSLAHLTWRYGRAARFPFALEAIKSMDVLIVRGVTCLQPLLDGLQVRYGAQMFYNLRSTFDNLGAFSPYYFHGPTTQVAGSHQGALKYLSLIIQGMMYEYRPAEAGHNAVSKFTSCR